MIAVFKCGKCGCNTQMYPQGTPIMEVVEDEVQVEVHEAGKDGKVNVRFDKQKRQRWVQKTRKMRRQNVFTGKVEEVEVGLEDLGNTKKTFQLQLKLDDETITKAVCPACYKKHIQPLAEQLWRALEKLRSL
jgi:ABC-type xylose transport system substrate-binding protein